MRATKTLRASLILFIFLAIAESALAQSQQPVRTTLFGWEDQTKQMILNQYQNYGGIFYDRGLFRFTTPSMTKEHDLDLITYDFTSADDYRHFYEPQNSFRAFAGSFNLGQFLHGTEIRNYIPATDRLTIPVRLVRRFDMRQDRALLWLGLNYQLREDHRIGLEHTVTEQKPDLDATFWYRFGEWASGAVQVEFTALDWANNAAYELSQRRGTDDPELRKIEQRPYFFSLKATTPVWNNLRGELVAGVQTPLQSVAESMEDTDESYRDRSRSRYYGVMAEYAIEHLTVGLSWRHRYASFSRTNAEDNFDEPVNYGNRQVENSLGGFLGVSYRRFYLENWVWFHYNRDQQWDEHEQEFWGDLQTYPFNFREHRWQMRGRIGFNRNTRGITAALQWSADYRDFLEGAYDWSGGTVYAFDYRQTYHNQLVRTNERLTAIFGYRFTEYIYLEIGASYDVDGDVIGGYYENEIHETSRFDGGFGRVVIRW